MLTVAADADADVAAFMTEQRLEWTHAGSQRAPRGRKGAVEPSDLLLLMDENTSWMNIP